MNDATILHSVQQGTQTELLTHTFLIAMVNTSMMVGVFTGPVRPCSVPAYSVSNAGLGPASTSQLIATGACGPWE